MKLSEMIKYEFPVTEGNFIRIEDAEKLQTRVAELEEVMGVCRAYKDILPFSVADLIDSCFEEQS